MSTAADRKKAREVYLATLNQQRNENTATATTAAPPVAPVAYTSREQKMNAREQMLEEKRLKFLQKSGKLPAASSDSSAGNSNSNPGPSSVIPPRFQPQAQQQQQPQQQQVQQAVDGTAPPESLQRGKHGDDGANTLANRYGKKDDPLYRPKNKAKPVAIPVSDPFSTEPTGDSRQGQGPDQDRDPFAHTIHPRDMQAVNSHHSVAEGGVGIGAIGQTGNPLNDKEAKRIKQAEYAKQLQQDTGAAPLSQQQHRLINNDLNSAGGGLGNIGQPNPLSDKEAKRNKQAEYARQLQQDNGATPISQQQFQQHRQDPSDNGGGGLGSIGGAPSDKEAKRNKQAEYARQLQQDVGAMPLQQPQHRQQYQQYSQEQAPVNTGGGLSSIGQSNTAYTNKDIKRAKQNEYARQLQQDSQTPIVGVGISGAGAGAGNIGGGGLFGDGDGYDEKAIKRAKQMEYNRQLQQDNPQSYQKNHLNQHNNHYHNNQAQGGYNLVTGGGRGGSDDPMKDEKALKRAKQMEYNRQLQEHEALKRQQDSAHSTHQHNLLKQYHNQNQSPSKQNMMGNQYQQSGSDNSLPDAGWEIGPLGQPVRKTLAVGNRGAQKAYTAKKHSPRKPDQSNKNNYHQNYNFNDGAGGGQFEGNQNNYQYFQPNDGNPQNMLNYMGNGPNSQGFTSNNGQDVFRGEGGGGGLDIFGNGNQNSSKNSSQSEYARAIEEQIRLKKESTAALKKAEAEEEARLYQKLERDRLDLQKAFEEEQKQKKLKEENERVASLDLQIQQKKQQKLEEEEKLKELERKEDARLARDQAALTAQLQEELRRDKSLDTKAAQQQKNLFDEQIVGRGEQSQESNNNLFRAPSPILDMHQRNKNLFRPSSSSIELDNNDNDNDSSEAFHPPRSPALPAQRKNQLFQAPSPVLERDQSGNTHNKQHLFNSASPPSSPMGNQNGRQHDRQQDSRSNKMSRERVRQTSSPNQRHHQQSPPPVQKQTVELDANHPIILDLKKETANARDEASRARKELEQLRQLVSQDRKRNIDKGATNNAEIPIIPLKHPSSHPQSNKHHTHYDNENNYGTEATDHDDGDSQRLDSARTFIRKYQSTYHADKPPEHPLRKSTKNHNNKSKFNSSFSPMERSLQSESFLQEPEMLLGSELPADFHSLMDLDKTLKSESRFVYPDGRAFVDGRGEGIGEKRPDSSSPRPQLQYHLQPYADAALLPVQLPSPPRKPSTPPPRKYDLPLDERVLSPSNAKQGEEKQMGQYSPTRSPQPLQMSVSTLGSGGPDSPAGSAVTLASERSKRRNSSNIKNTHTHAHHQHSSNEKDNNDDDTDGLEFDIDKAFRRNRRKYALLEKMGVRVGDDNDQDGGVGGGRDFNVFSGPEELDLLLNGLHSVSSSRPTTAGTSRPSRPTTSGTLQGESQLVNKRDYGDLLQQEREKYKQKQQLQASHQGYSRRRNPPATQPHAPVNRRESEQMGLRSRPSSSFSRSRSPLISPRSPHSHSQRAHSQGSKIRKSNTLQASGRRAIGGDALVYPENDNNSSTSNSSSIRITPIKGGEVEDDDGSYNLQLANTMEKNKFDAMVKRRNSNIQDRLSTAFSEGQLFQEQQKQRQHHHEREQQLGRCDVSVGERQLYASFSAEQVQDIDFSDYGF